MHVLSGIVLTQVAALTFFPLIRHDTTDVHARSARERRGKREETDVLNEQYQVQLTCRGKKKETNYRDIPNRATVSSGRQPGLHCPGLPFLPPENRHHCTSTSPPPPSTLFSTFLSVCRDNPLHQPRSTANKRVLPRKSSPLNPTWRHSVRFPLRIPRPRAPRRAAQSASSRPLPSSRVGSKKPSPHDWRLQDEGQNEDIVFRQAYLSICVCRSRLLCNRFRFWARSYIMIIYHDLTGEWI